MGLRMDADRECHFSGTPDNCRLIRSPSVSPGRDSSTHLAQQSPPPVAATPAPPRSLLSQARRSAPGDTAYDRSQPNCDEAQLEERLFGGHVDIN